MANIISPICFSNANNDSANNGSDFKVSVCKNSVWICVLSFFFFKAQEIDVPLASTGRLATESELHMFSLKTMQRCAELGWAVKFRLVYDLFSLDYLPQVESSCFSPGYKLFF